MIRGVSGLSVDYLTSPTVPHHSHDDDDDSDYDEDDDDDDDDGDIYIMMQCLFVCHEK